MQADDTGGNLAHIKELRELSFAVRNFDEARDKFERMGFRTTEPWTETTPPVQAKLTSMPVANSSISIMASTDGDTPISKFLERRGEGIFSFTFVVDDIRAITDQWRSAGVEFVLDEPIEITDGFSVGQPIPKILGNWTRPSTLHGIVIELQEFLDDEGNSYAPPAQGEVTST